MKDRLKAILRYDLKEIKTVMIVFAVFNGIISLVMFYNMQSTAGTYDHYTFFIESVTDTMRVAAIMFIMVMLLLVIIQYSDIKTQGTYCFMASLPAKKGNWMLSKLLIGFAMLTISFIYITILASILYNQMYAEFSRANVSSAYYTQLSRADSLGNAILYILYIYLLVFASYLLLMFCQSISGNLAAGLFFAAVIVIAPRYLMGTANNIMLLFENKELPNYNILHSISLDYLITDIDVIIADEKTAAVDLSFVPVRLAVLSLVDLLMCGVNYLVYRKTDYSSQRVFLHKPVEVIGVIITGVFAACIVPQVSESKQHGLLFLLVIMSLVGVITIFLLWRYLRSNGRYDYLNGD